MAEVINENKIKTIRKYSCKLKQDSFGVISGEEQSTLAFETNYNPDNHVTREVRFSKTGEIEEIHDYTYDQNKKVVHHHWTMPLDGVEETEKMERDEKGRLLREIKLYGADEGESVNYIYDVKGNVIAAEYKDEEGNPTLKEEFEYTGNETLLTRRTTDFIEGKNKFIKFIYNDKNNLAEQQDLDDKGGIITKTLYEQDENGNDVSIVQYNSKNEITQRVNTTYNESGKQIKRIARGFFTRIAEFEYDEKGNVLDEITKDENGTIISRNSFEYNENNLLVFETYFEIDLTHSGRDVNIANRFEYEFH